MSGERILVFDPDVAHREAARASLCAAGLRAAIAKDTKEVLRNIREAPPDLLLLDWNLPDASGIEVLTCVREQRGRREIRVLINSALASESDIVAGLEVGADDPHQAVFAPGTRGARQRAAARPLAPGRGQPDRSRGPDA